MRAVLLIGAVLIGARAVSNLQRGWTNDGIFQVVIALVLLGIYTRMMRNPS